MKWYDNPLIIKSSRKFKKFAVVTPRGLIHFGDKRYKDYTQHKNEKKRISYLKRAKGIIDKSGKKTINNPYSANYWASRILWHY